MRTETTEILIIGAGLAGPVAAGFLRQQDQQVLIIEKEQFPRFSTYARHYLFLAPCLA